MASDAVSEIQSWNANLSSSDKNAKYCKMQSSEFVFYRGTNHLYWQDFANDSRLSTFGNSHTKTWLQGDLHAYNFGAFDNDDKTIVYGLNDFDETIIADYQYDVWRMAISIVLIMRENNKNGVVSLSTSEQKDVIDEFSETYLDAMRDYRGNSDEVSQIFTKHNTYGRLDNFLDDVESNNSRLEMLDDWSKLVNNRRQFNLDSEDLQSVSSSTKSALSVGLANYGSTLSGGLNYESHYFEIKDVAKRLNAGTGSLGTQRYYILIESETTSNSDDRILDIKLQGKPTPYYYISDTLGFANDAERHAIGYKALSNNTDDHLGWLTFDNKNYSVRERSPFKKSFKTDVELSSETRFVKLAQQWGNILASSHARADKDYNSSYVADSLDKEIDNKTDGKHSAFRALVRDIAFSYANQVESDYQSFKDEVNPSCL
jgi:uncharacterized protein (DUF2252 family)